MIVLLNIDNCSKTLAFKKFQCLTWKHYTNIIKTYKKQPNRLGNRQFFVLLYGCIQNEICFEQ